MRWRVRAAALLVAGLVVNAPAAAQQPGPPPVVRTPAAGAVIGRPADTTRAVGVRADTGRGGRIDTTKKELVVLAPTDSVMDALLKRKGYSSTRYQGDQVVYDAAHRDLRMIGKPAAVSRGRTLLVGANVTYNDSTETVEARGDTVTLRDPDKSAEDMVSYGGGLRYNIPESRGVAMGLTTKIENKGSKWVVYGHLASLQNKIDSTAADTLMRKQSIFYAKEGTITSCEDSLPHYHFNAGEMKVIANGIMVARPAVLYIADVPVAWLPFIFQDMRQGTRSGILTPRLGVSELLRNSSTYQRTVENMGYYFSLNNYMDATIAMDWRSGARPQPGDPGFSRFSGEWRYRWLSRFLDGRLGYSYLLSNDGNTSTTLTLTHRQSFSQTSMLNASLNFSSNTTALRNTIINPFASVSTIRSDASYSRALGPFTMNLGGNQTQYLGRSQVDRSFPILSISSQPVSVTSWLLWTPSFSFTQQQTLDLDQAGQFSQRYITNAAGRVDSVAIKQNTKTTAISLGTPLKFGNFDLPLSFTFNDQLNDFPQTRIIQDVNDSSQRTTRVFARTFASTADFTLSLSLPSFRQGTWNIVPSIALQNVESSPYFVRNERTGGTWISQAKRLSYGLSASPTFFALFGGFGPVARLRHTVTTRLSYNYAPKADVSDEFLAAWGRTRQGYLGALQQSALSFGLNQNIEAKLRGATDSTEGRKIKLLSLDLSAFNYDFERASVIRQRRSAAGLPAPSWIAGLTTERFDMSARSDLLPDFSLSMGWSLFQGSTLSDSAVFDPYRESITAGLQLNAKSPIVGYVRRLLGIHEEEAPPVATQPTGTPGAQLTANAAQSGSLANGGQVGLQTRNQQYQIPTGQGWRVSLSFSSNRTRPQIGGTVITVDPLIACAPFRQTQPLLYDQCRANPQNLPPTSQVQNTSPGGVSYVTAAMSNLQFQYGFNLTDKWAAQWSSSYDFERHEFASHVVSFQRDMHDWRATFSYTQAPTGNASFSFFISLKAEPELKFNYDRATLGAPRASAR